jgi:hypothetical protein
MKTLHVGASVVTTYLRRVFRMADLRLARRVTWRNFLKSLRPSQKAVSLIGGGMVFCDREDEHLFFQENESWR